MANNYFGVRLPELKNAKLDLWQFLSPNDLQALVGCFDAPVLNQYALFSQLIAKQLNLDIKSKKDTILVDKYFYLIKFCIDNQFTLEQISAILSVQIRTHRVAVETSFGNLDETFNYFKNALLCYAVHRPPFSLNLFKPSQIQTIIDYFLNSYFKQFKFYKYVFSLGIRVDLNFTYTNQPVVVDEDSQNLEFDVSLIRPESQLTTDQERHMEELSETNENPELRAFIKDYLNKHLSVMKTDLLNENLFVKKQSLEVAQRSKSGSSGTKTPSKKK